MIKVQYTERERPRDLKILASYQLATNFLENITPSVADGTISSAKQLIQVLDLFQSSLHEIGRNFSLETLQIVIEDSIARTQSAQICWKDKSLAILLRYRIATLEKIKILVQEAILS